MLHGTFFNGWCLGWVGAIVVVISLIKNANWTNYIKEELVWLPGQTKDMQTNPDTYNAIFLFLFPSSFLFQPICLSLSSFTFSAFFFCLHSNNRMQRTNFTKRKLLFCSYCPSSSSPHPHPWHCRWWFDQFWPFENSNFHFAFCVIKFNVCLVIVLCAQYLLGPQHVTFELRHVSVRKPKIIAVSATDTEQRRNNSYSSLA